MFSTVRIKEKQIKSSSTWHHYRTPKFSFFPSLCLSFPNFCCVAPGMKYTFQNLWVINLVFPKFPDSCCWGASCNYLKNHRASSTTTLALARAHHRWYRPKWVPQAFLSHSITTDKLGTTQNNKALKQQMWKSNDIYMGLFKYQQ